MNPQEGLSSNLPDPITDEVTPRPTQTSLIAVQRFTPWWRPWLPTSAFTVTAGFVALGALLAVFTLRVTKHWVVKHPLAAPIAAVQAEVPKLWAAVIKPAPPADAALVRERRSPVSGGLLTLPPAFHSADGAYDLVIHFHGNTDLVEESFAASGLNAVVIIMNLGTGSGPYEDRFGNPGSLPEMLERTQTTMEKRGLAHAHLRRLALSAWSAGYGAVLKVLEQPALAAKVDAVMLLDGIHVGYKPEGGGLILERLAPFARFAREAVEGKRLFSITHSDIIPAGHYAGTRETTDAVLHAVGVERSPGGETLPVPPLHALDGVLPKKQLVPMEPETVAHQAALTVRGYAGDQPEHHIMHLVQMSETVLADLAAWWKKP